MGKRYHTKGCLLKFQESSCSPLWFSSLLMQVAGPPLGGQRERHCTPGSVVPTAPSPGLGPTSEQHSQSGGVCVHACTRRGYNQQRQRGRSLDTDLERIYTNQLESPGALPSTFHVSGVKPDFLPTHD